MIEKLAAFIAAFFALFKLGQATSDNKKLEEQLKGNEEVNKIHNRIDTDSAYRDRIRELFRGK